MIDTNTRRVMVARHHGWEGASPSLLAKVFGMSPQRATAILRERCAACGRPICGCTDDQWKGQAPPSRVAHPRGIVPGAASPGAGDEGARV